MDIQTISGKCVALVVHKGVSDPKEAAGLVRSALALRGLPCWRRMEVELFPSGGDTLILAHPSDGVFVTVADWVRPFLSSE